MEGRLRLDCKNFFMKMLVRIERGCLGGAVELLSQEVFQRCVVMALRVFIYCSLGRVR